MKTLILNIPDNLGLKEDEVSIYLAAKLYEDKKLSMGQAAKFCGMEKRDFMEVLGKYGVSFTNITVEDLKQDIENAKNYRI